MNTGFWDGLQERFQVSASTVADGPVTTAKPASPTVPPSAASQNARRRGQSNG